MFTCKICNQEFDSKLYQAHEVRFGWGDAFDYLLCPHCGCVQIKEIPADLGKYYSGEYYSLVERTEKEDNGFLKRTLRKHLLRYRLTGKDPIGWLLAQKEKNAFEWIEPHEFNFDSSFLDVGCGTGRTLLKLAQSGFKKVQGTDPFNQNEIVYHLDNHEIKIFNKDVCEIQQKYDVIMLNHVWEHIATQHETMQALANIMHKDSKLILTLPLFSQFTWDHYGIEAHQFTDAPRHLFIHTLESLCGLARQYGLKLTHKKFFYYYKMLEDVHGNMSPEIQAMDKEALVRELMEKEDIGHAYLYFMLNK